MRLLTLATTIFWNIKDPIKYFRQKWIARQDLSFRVPIVFGRELPMRMRKMKRRRRQVVAALLSPHTNHSKTMDSPSSLSSGEGSASASSQATSDVSESSGSDYRRSTSNRQKLQKVKAVAALIKDGLSMRKACCRQTFSHALLLNTTNSKFKTSL